MRRNAKGKQNISTQLLPILYTLSEKRCAPPSVLSLTRLAVCLSVSLSFFLCAEASAGIVEEKDPERILKLKECCDMLLAGGYFRARIPTLSPFDKVVGGLAWSITASGVDVDVDVIFQENASIGQKM
jgi:hypothetical protein